MAKIFLPNGRDKYRAQLNINNKRVSLMLNKSKSVSEHIVYNIELIHSYIKSSLPLPPAQQEFINALDSYTRDKLLSWGLIKANDGIFIDELLEKYANELITANKTKKYIGECLSKIEKCFTWNEYVLPKDITIDGIRSYLAYLKGRGKTVRTYNSYLQAIKSFCKWLIKKKQLFIELDLLSKIKSKPNEKIKRRVMTEDEIEHLIESIKGDYNKLSPEERKIIYLLALDAGLRWGEISKLEVGDIKLKSQTIVIRAEIEKARRGAVLPLSDAILSYLIPYLTDIPRLPILRLFDNMPSEKGARMLRHDLENAEIEYKTYDGQIDFHSLRHTYGTRLALSGVQPQIHKELMRHSSIDITMNYYVHFKLENLKEGISKLGNRAQNRSKISG